ncbi:hypothetical protein HND97_00055 [Vibrio cholerae]|nr:hypothetical protein HND97_00055 [Vibrio cholerae]
MALFRGGLVHGGMVDNFRHQTHGREDISYPDEEGQ